MKRENEISLTSWNALDEILQGSEPRMLSAAGDGAATASEGTVSCRIVRGPMMESTALCAIALPPPNAIPEEIK